MANIYRSCYLIGHCLIEYTEEEEEEQEEEQEEELIVLLTDILDNHIYKILHQGYVITQYGLHTISWFKTLDLNHTSSILLPLNKTSFCLF